MTIRDTGNALEQKARGQTQRKKQVREKKKKKKKKKMRKREKKKQKKKKKKKHEVWKHGCVKKKWLPNTAARMEVEGEQMDYGQQDQETVNEIGED